MQPKSVVPQVRAAGCSVRFSFRCAVLPAIQHRVGAKGSPSPHLILCQYSKRAIYGIAVGSAVMIKHEAHVVSPRSADAVMQPWAEPEPTLPGGRDHWILRVRWFAMGAPPRVRDLCPHLASGVVPIYETGPRIPPPLPKGMVENFPQQMRRGSTWLSGRPGAANGGWLWHFHVSAGLASLVAIAVFSTLSANAARPCGGRPGGERALAVRRGCEGEQKGAAGDGGAARGDAGGDAGG